MPLFKMTAIVKTRQVFAIYVDATDEEAVSRWSERFENEADVGRCVHEEFTSEVETIEPVDELPEGARLNTVASAN